MVVRRIELCVFLTILLLFPGINTFSQDKFWIVFTDKNGVEFNPFEYFDQKTVEKRLRFGIPLVEYSDLPVRQDYLDRIKEYGNISSSSRWLNAVSMKLEEEEINKVRNLDFVEEVRLIDGNWTCSGHRDGSIGADQLKLLKAQIDAFNGTLFTEKGINGKGVRIAVFDIGFTGVDTLEIFRHLREEGKIIKTYDFVERKENVYHFATHGTTVLGCIAGVLDSLHFGLAPGAEFLLARTEVKAEIFEEEEYWAAAMEWADRNGADIISSSLGYTEDRYFPKQMDGKTVYVTRIANLAASKGILVINAAGNEGDKDWEVIGAPADADSVLSVGGIGEEGIHISFSSFGPTADGRMKPNVVAFGKVISTGKSTVKQSYGTSFATPLITGFAACVMQMHPDWDNMKVFEEIQRSGHLYPYYDYAHGYGVPQASYFLDCSEHPDRTFEFRRLVDMLEIKLVIKGLKSNVLSENEHLERFDMDDQYLYYHIFSPKTDKIRKYAVIRMEAADRYNIPVSDLKKGEIVRVFYRGFSDEYIYHGSHK